MTPKGKPKIKKNRETQKIIVSVAGLVMGYYMLNHVATWERPIFGNTFHIIMGCLIIAASVIYLAIVLKSRFFPKKQRRSRSSHVFLDDILKKEDQKKS